MDIADRFCKYFTNIGPNLASAIPTVNSATFRSFLGSKDHPPIILKPTNTRELESICSLFSPRKVSGYDNISMRDKAFISPDFRTSGKHYKSFPPKRYLPRKTKNR